MVLDDRRPGVIPLREMLRQAAAMPACLDKRISPAASPRRCWIYWC
jgi:hypothetical protein